MDCKKEILNRELTSPSSYANFIEEDYGYLFFDEENKSSHDSNHAVIFPNKVANLEEVINRIKDFYIKKNIKPRIYQPYINNYFMDNASTFRKNSWDVQIYGLMNFMVLKEENKIKNENRLKVVELKEWDERIAEDIFIPNGSLYEIEVTKKSMKNKDFKVFVAYLNEKAISLATLDYGHPNIACLRSAETAEELRGNGYARELIYYLIEYHKKHSNHLLYVWPLNKTSEKIFKEGGFRTEFTAEAGSAIYNKMI